MKLGYAVAVFLALMLAGCDRARHESEFLCEVPITRDMKDAYVLARIDTPDDTGINTVVVKRMSDEVFFRAIVSAKCDDEIFHIKENSAVRLKVRSFRSSVGGDWILMFVVQCPTGRR